MTARPAAAGNPPDVAAGSAIGLFESIRRHALALAIVVGFAATCGYLVSSWQPPSYEASIVLLFSEGSDSFADQALPAQDRGRYLATQADLVGSWQVADAAASALGDGTPAAEVTAALTAIPGEVSNTLTIVGTAADAARAARLADAGAAGYIAVLREQARASAAAAVRILQRQYEDIQRRIDRLVQEWPPVVGAVETRSALRDRLTGIAVEQSRMRAAAENYQPAVRVVRPAATPTSPVSPVPLRDGGLAALIAGCSRAVRSPGRTRRGRSADRTPVGSPGCSAPGASGGCPGPGMG